MTQQTFKTHWFRYLYLMCLFSVFHQHQIFKHRSTSRIDRWCLQFASFSSQPLKTNIRNFSEEVSSLYHTPEMITVEILQKLCVERLKLWTSFVILYSASPKKHCDTTRKFRAFFRPVIWSVIFLFSFFFSLFPFFPIVRAFFLPKIWNYRQRSFSLPFKMPNLHPSLDIRQIEL